MNKAELKSKVQEIIQSSRFWEPNAPYSIETVSEAIVDYIIKSTQQEKNSCQQE